MVPVYTQYSRDECGWPDDVLRNIEAILAEHIRMIRRAFEHDALLMAGTDAGCPGVEMGQGLRTELMCMANAGIDAMYLLKMATVTNAELCAAKQYTGRIEIGGPASFAVYKKPPWEDIVHLNSIVSVYHQRHEIKSTATGIEEKHMSIAS